MKLAAKQNRLLESLAKMPVIAPWSNIDLVKMGQMGLVDEQIALGANGRVHSSKVYTLSAKGRGLLAERTGA